MKNQHGREPYSAVTLSTPSLSLFCCTRQVAHGHRPSRFHNSRSGHLAHFPGSTATIIVGLAASPRRQNGLRLAPLLRSCRPGRLLESYSRRNAPRGVLGPLATAPPDICICALLVISSLPAMHPTGASVAATWASARRHGPRRKQDWPVLAGRTPCPSSLLRHWPPSEKSASRPAGTPMTKETARGVAPNPAEPAGNDGPGSRVR